MKECKNRSEYQNWKNELDAFEIYQALAHIEKDNSKGLLFKKLSEESLNQANIWKAKLSNERMDWKYSPSLRVKILLLLLKVTGPRFIIDLLPSFKIRGISLYRHEEQLLKQGHGNNEKIHSKIKSGSNLRAAIFGVNDGLVSNASLVFAMVGASSESHTIILTGIAGLLAGSFSMAAGEYISVRSQTELFENQIAIERGELEEFPEEEAKELSLIYQAKGIDLQTANQMASTIVQDKEKALDTLAREELGLNPNELGSALQAASSSLFSFSFGAILPLIPFIFFDKNLATPVSLGLSLVSLFSIGLAISLMTGKSPILSGLRMCALGLLAGTTTYLIGSLIGVANP